MPKSEIIPDKIVVISGAGLSAPSGLATFRDAGGLWENHRIEDVASIDGWLRDPQTVLEFYNERRIKACNATPNEGHRAIASLEQRFRVVIITQNVDDLHERAGSSHVVHLHGELTKARSTRDPALTYKIGNSPIRISDKCELGSQLRPDIVWFGEEVQHLDEAQAHVQECAILLVVGTSLTVYPAAGLVNFASDEAEKIVINTELVELSHRFHLLKGSADKVLPDWAQAKLRK